MLIKNLVIEFYLNDKSIKTTIAPATTALQLIREHLGLTGAKEVCAEGDCGACTIAVGKWRQSSNDTHKKEFIYQALNSCILPAARLHDCHIITIEGLAQNNKLNLIQQMMLDYHAVQCGYCSAGIIMSLFCLFAHKSQPTHDNIVTALAGNLCRCTGYKAIYEAAQKVNEHLQHATSKAATSTHLQESIFPSMSTTSKGN